MPDFDVFSFLEIRKRKRRSHGKRQKGNDKRKRCAAQKSGTSLNNLHVCWTGVPDATYQVSLKLVHWFGEDLKDFYHI